MIDLLYLFIGLLAGASVAWLLASSRTRSAAEGRIAEAEREATSLQATAEAIRKQLDALTAELSESRDSLSSERSNRVEAETRLNETEKRLQEEKKLLDEAKTRLTDAFKSLAGDTLSHTNKQFLSLAKETFDKVLSEAKGDLGKREEAIKGLVKPLSDSLKQFGEHVRGLETTRQQAYTSLDEQLKTLATTQQQLQRETGNLVTALRTPQVRGRWGEITLKRVVELSGMSEHCDFSEQVTAQTETGRIRPDMIVHLPGGREIVVDVKVSLEGYLRAISAETDEDRQQALVDHARQIRTHMNQLGAKSYSTQFDSAPEFVVMFIPGEPFFAAAVDQDHALIEDGMEQGVVLATPTTFIALLKAVAYGWRQEQIADNAQQISDLGRDLYDRMRVMASHLSDIGRGITRATEAYNKAVGSMEARVLPSARRFRELGAATSDEIGVVEPVEATPRELAVGFGNDGAEAEEDGASRPQDPNGGK